MAGCLCLGCVFSSVGELVSTNRVNPGPRSPPPTRPFRRRRCSPSGALHLRDAPTDTTRRPGRTVIVKEAQKELEDDEGGARVGDEVLAARVERLGMDTGMRPVPNLWGAMTGPNGITAGRGNHQLVNQDGDSLSIQRSGSSPMLRVGISGPARSPDSRR